MVLTLQRKVSSLVFAIHMKLLLIYTLPCSLTLTCWKQSHENNVRDLTETLNAANQFNLIETVYVNYITFSSACLMLLNATDLLLEADILDSIGLISPFTIWNSSAYTPLLTYFMPLQWSMAWNYFTIEYEKANSEVYSICFLSPSFYRLYIYIYIYPISQLSASSLELPAVLSSVHALTSFTCDAAAQDT